MRAWLIAAALAAGLAASGCERPSPDARPPGPAPRPTRHALPERASVGGALPEVTLRGVDRAGKVEASVRALVSGSETDLVAFVVSGGAWCGTCQWIAQRGPEAFGNAADRVRRVDVILGDRDNAPADAEAAERYRDAYPSLGQGVVLADPDDRLRPLGGDRAAMLPRVLLVDASTLEVLEVASNPSPAELQHLLTRALATRDGTPPPPRPEPELVDGLLLPHEWELLARTRLPAAPPADPSNAVADSPAAAALGRALFFDPGLSGSGELSCASCHQPQRALSDGQARAQGAGQGTRKTPSIALAAHARWQFWDGRADSLWAQALGPIEAEAELDGSRVAVARRLLTQHAPAYRAAFSDAPLPDPSRWPETGKPGEPVFDTLPSDEREAITRVFVDAGKAIAAWERTLRVQPNRLDAYLAGDTEALAPTERYGLHLFVRQGCMQCHWGPRLTDDAFHAVALSNPLAASAQRQLAARDPGRTTGVSSWMRAEFRRDGRWSDDPDGDERHTPPDPTRLAHQFKTPALRGVADASHWGHAGQFDQLAGVTEAYGTPPLETTSPREAWVPTFNETVQWGLVPFLALLTAEPTGL